MRKLRGKITQEQAAEAWSADNSTQEKNMVMDPMKKLYRCMQCCLQEKPCMKRPESFGIYKPSDLMPKLFMDGMWTRCQSCQQSLSRSALSSIKANGDEAHRHAAEEAAEEANTNLKRMICTVCKTEKLIVEFPSSVQKNWGRAHRRCRACHRCPGCGNTLLTLDFDPDGRRCKTCVSEEKQYLCEVCEETKPAAEFSTSVIMNWRKPARQHRCLQCQRCSSCQ